MTADALQPLLAEPLTGSLIEVDDTTDPSAAADRLTAAGWNTRIVGPFHDRGGFYSRIAAALEFPSYFGHNLDALWDALTDLTAPYAVIIDWQPFLAADPDYAAKVRATLAERTTSEPPFAVILQRPAATQG